MQLAIKHGLQTAYRDYANLPTVAQIKADSGLRMELGYGDNVKVLINSVEQPDHIQIPGPSCTVETAANSKA